MMKNTKGQTSVSVIFGIGVLLICIGSFVFLDAYKNLRLGVELLGTVEFFMGFILLIFGAISIYMSHK